MNYKCIEKIVSEIEKEFPFPCYISSDLTEYINSVLSSILDVLVRKNGKLLDIGSGPMDKTAIFSKFGFDCYAVDDLSDPWHQHHQNIELIKSFALESGIKFYHQENGDYDIPFAKNSFDVVLSNDVIEHLHTSPREYLNTAFNFAKVGGIVVLTVPNSVNFRKRLSVLFGKTNYPPIDGFFYSGLHWRGHVREYTLSEAAYIIKQAGGDILVNKTYHSALHKKISIASIRYIYRCLTFLVPTLRDGILIIARKPENWKPLLFDEVKYLKSISKCAPTGAYENILSKKKFS